MKFFVKHFLFCFVLFYSQAQTTFYLAPVKDSDTWKWSYMTPEGEIKFTLNSDIIYAKEFSGNMAPIQNKKEFWGFVDPKGSIKIVPKYPKVEAFDEVSGIALVHDIEKGPIYINQDGNQPFEIEAIKIYEFRKGGAFIRTEQGLQIINSKGEVVANSMFFDSIKRDHEGNFIVKKDRKSGIYSPSGKQIVPLEYDFVGSFAYGYAPSRKNEEWGFVDSNNTFHQIPNAVKLWDFRNGFARFRSNDRGHIGYFNTSLEPQINAIYSEGKHFGEGHVGVEHKNKWGFINENGKPVGPQDLEFALAFYDGYGIFMGNDRVGIIDSKGKVVMEPDLYVFTGSFSGFAGTVEMIVEGTVRLRLKKGKGLFGFINIETGQVVNKWFDRVGKFREVSIPE